jgi:hypothetical protein
MASKKITQLPINTLPTMDGVMPIVLSGTTYQSPLSNLRQNLVDSGSHHFTGSQHISGSVNVTGSLYVTNTGSINYLSVGDYVGPRLYDPESLRVVNSGSVNSATFFGDHHAYVQINVHNLNTGSNASTDIVATADNGDEMVYYVDMGINSSTNDGGFVGYANDAYLVTVGKDLYVGAVGGTDYPSELKLFSQNEWENPQITVHAGSQVTFNTSSFTEGYMYEFSGSAKYKNDVTVDDFLNIGSVNERIVQNVSGGTETYEFDYNSGSVYYLTSSLGDNVYNVSNVPTENNQAISITFILKQELTPYIASSYKLNNEEVTVSWAGNEQPIGNINKTDVIGLTALRVGSSWNVLGTFTTFG